MHFIRKGGRVIPIRDGSATQHRHQAAAQDLAVATGAAAAGSGLLVNHGIRKSFSAIGQYMKTGQISSKLGTKYVAGLVTIKAGGLLGVGAKVAGIAAGIRGYQSLKKSKNPKTDAAKIAGAGLAGAGAVAGSYYGGKKLIHHFSAKRAVGVIARVGKITVLKRI